MRLRTKAVGATTLALLGFLVAVHVWATSPLPSPTFELAKERPVAPARTFVADSSDGPTAEPRDEPIAEPISEPHDAPEAEQREAPEAGPLLEPSDESALRQARAPAPAPRPHLVRERAPQPEPGAAEPPLPREAPEPEADPELQRVPLEPGLTRAEPVDLRTGEGLEASQPAGIQPMGGGAELDTAVREPDEDAEPEDGAAPALTQTP